MIGVAVVGCGYWGPNIIRNFSSLEGCELRVICDRDSERLAVTCALASDPLDAERGPHSGSGMQSFVRGAEDDQKSRCLGLEVA